MTADQPGHGGADGRGHLSEQRLAGFATFLLAACIDEVCVMEVLMRPQGLRERILAWCKAKLAISANFATGVIAKSRPGKFAYASRSNVTPSSNTRRPM